MTSVLPSIRSFACVAIVLHLLLIASLPFWIEQTKAPPAKPRKIAVQTVALNPKVTEVKKPRETREAPPKPQPVEQVAIAEAAPQPKVDPKPKKEPEKKETPKQQEKKETPQKKQQTVKKETPVKKNVSPKSTSKKSVKKKEEIKKSSQPKKPVKSSSAKSSPKTSSSKSSEKNSQVKAAAEKQHALVANAQKAISQVGKGKKQKNIGTSDDRINTSLSQLKTLEVGSAISYGEELLTGQELTYYQELASRIKMQLRLPKYGEVQVKLTLRRSGEFVRLKIEHAANSENRKYIESKLPHLTYPPFGNNFSEQDQYTFLLSLSNEL